MRKSKGLLGFVEIFVIAAIVGTISVAYLSSTAPKPMGTFGSCDEMASSFNKMIESRQNAWRGGGLKTFDMVAGSAVPMAATMAVAEGSDESGDYSDTNVQVAGVDEADIIKTDGNYIYTVTQGYDYGFYGFDEVAVDDEDADSESRSRNPSFVIVDAYPAEDASILSETDLGEFQPTEIFIEKDRLLIFGSTYEEITMGTPAAKVASDSGVSRSMIAPIYPTGISIVTVQLWDISDRKNPELIRTVDLEGSYLTSRKIESDVYFVVNSYPRYQLFLEAASGSGDAGDIIPLYRDSESGEEELVPSCGCDDVGYFDDVIPERFVTLASMSMADDDAEVVREVILGSGQSVYASPENLYVVETSWPYWPVFRTMSAEELEAAANTEETVIHKFSLDGGKITYDNHGKVPGHVLNQFSMDEHNGYFRIATTTGRTSRSGESLSSNNVYVLDSGLVQVGEIEDIAPGESIYSARFMGDRGYLVTFKKIDPFFVIDLSDPENPEILGKLKIPGYSDYLHPYDDDHIIGIGKETVEAEEERGDFAWYQGLKMAIFDVTDVSNPTELHKIIIGDRGTDSDALHDHKAFLFDREKNLLVIPILLAEIADKENIEDWSYGDYVYQGAYVYDLTLEDGFQLKGRVTHVDDEELFLKSGYYYAGGQYSVKRNLYIGDVLYTLSASKLKLNALDDLEELKELVFS